jgi:signal transduction histidine kinase
MGHNSAREGSQLPLDHHEPAPKRAPGLSVVPLPAQPAGRFAELVAQVLRCRCCSITLWDTSGGLILDEQISAQPQRASERPVVESSRSSFIDSASSLPPDRALRSIFPTAGGSSLNDTRITVPLVMPDGSYGAITALDREDGRPFESADLQVLESLCQFFSSSLELRARRELLRLQNEIRALRKQAIRTEEHERQRLSRELHDDIGHALTTAILSLDMQWQRLSNDLAACEALTVVREALTECADRLHEFAFHLRPAVLQDLGLVPALRSLARRIGETGAVDANVNVHGTERRLSSEVELAAFRIVQESHTNAMKHAQASRITTDLKYADESIEVLISDNGIGLPPLTSEHYLNRHGQGLSGMRERAELVGGTLEVESLKGRGTTITARLPIKEIDHG